MKRKKKFFIPFVSFISQSQWWIKYFSTITWCVRIQSLRKKKYSQRENKLPKLITIGPIGILPMGKKNTTNHKFMKRCDRYKKKSANWLAKGNVSFNWYHYFSKMLNEHSSLSSILPYSLLLSNALDEWRFFLCTMRLYLWNVVCKCMRPN